MVYLGTRSRGSVDVSGTFTYTSNRSPVPAQHALSHPRRFLLPRGSLVFIMDFLWVSSNIVENVYSPKCIRLVGTNSLFLLVVQNPRCVTVVAKWSDLQPPPLPRKRIRFENSGTDQNSNRSLTEHWLVKSWESLCERDPGAAPGHGYAAEHSEGGWTLQFH